MKKTTLKTARRLAAAACLAIGLWAVLLPAQEKVAPSSSAPRVVEIPIDDAIFPATADFVVDSFERVKQQGATLVLITMNTPGGLDTSMREIIGAIIHSPAPVAVFVAPSGSRAASAGFFILLSADIAAMAPGTDTGASTPIFGGGEKVDDTLKSKAKNEAAAYMRSIVGHRGRNVDLAEKAVTEAKAYSATEALDGKLIDLIAPNTDELIKLLDGRTVTRFDGTKVKLELKGAVRVSQEMTTRQKWFSYIARPDVLFILFSVGMLGIYVEFTHPGLIFPGVIGVVSLILALVAMKVLPINVIAVVLILGAIGLFIMEAKVTSYGLLGLAGVVAMLVGAMMLIRSPITGFRVSWSVALGVTLPFALICVFLMQLVLRSFHWKPATGTEQMVGELGEVTEAIDGRGMIFVAGELWRAAAGMAIPKGSKVRVTKVDGLTAYVELAGEPKKNDQA